MADELRQQIALDAAKALDTLRKLDGALKGFDSRILGLGKTMNLFNQQSGALEQRLDEITAALRRMTTTGAQAQFGQLNAQATRSLNNINRNVNDLTTSMKLLSRIVFTQTIVRGLSQLRNAVRESIGDTVEFQREIGRVQTIAGGVGFDTLAQQARQVSVNLGIDQLDVAQGLYQTISNQVGDAADSFRFFNTAAQFAKTTNATTSESVDLLSAALKSYNLTVGQSEEIAGKFFVAIDKGRVQAKDLANTIGRVVPVAAELGVSLDEVNAFLAASTVTGTKSAEAITQLRGTLSAFLKPSDAMKQALAQLGFESGEQATRLLGLRGAFEAVRGTTDGSETALAKLFPNIRALTGILAVFNGQLDIYNATIKESENATELFRSKVAIVANVDGEKFNRALEAMKTGFSEAFGDPIVRAVANLTDLTGGAQNFSLIGTAAASTLQSLGIAAGLLGVHLLTASTRGTQLVATLGQIRAAGGGAAALLALAPVAQDLGNLIGRKLTEARDRQSGRTQRIDTLNRDLNDFRKLQEAQLQLSKVVNDRRFKDTESMVVKLNQLYQQDVSNAEKALRELETSARATTEQIASSMQTVIRELSNKIREASKLVEDSRKRVDSTLQNLEKRRFERSISGRSDVSQSSALLNRAREQVSTSLSQLGSATDEQSVERAVNLFEEAVQNAERAAEIAKSGGIFVTERNALIVIEEAMKRRIDAERQLQTLQSQRQAKLEQEKRAEEARLKTFRDAQKQLLANINTETDAQGGALSPADQAKRRKLRDEALENIVKSGLTSGRLNELETLGLVDLQKRLSSTLTQKPLEFKANVEEVSKQIQDGLSKKQFIIDIKSQRDASLKSISELEEQQRQFEARQKGIEEARAKAAENLRAVQPGRARNSTANGVQSGLINELQALAQPNTTVTLEKLRSVISQLETLKSSGALGTLGTSRANVSEFENTIVELSRVFDLQKEVAQSPFFTGEGQTRLQQAQDTFNGVKVSLEDANNSSEQMLQFFKRIEAASAGAASNMERAAAAAAAANQVGTGGSGAAGFAVGGPARGTDKIPAMLSPGEFVINADSSKRFYSQLVAMNAGHSPRGFAEGGSVSNTTVGDIHVHESRSPRATARAVMSEIRRETRRRTSRI